MCLLTHAQGSDGLLRAVSSGSFSTGEGKDMTTVGTVESRLVTAQTCPKPEGLRRVPYHKKQHGRFLHISQVLRHGSHGPYERYRRQCFTL